MKEKNKQKQNKNKCPLCQVSEETLKKLKEAGEKKRPKKRMKNKLLILVFIVGLIGLGIFVFYQFSFNQSKVKTEEKSQGILDILAKGLKVGDLAPDFVSEDVDGNKISLSDFRDEKPVLLVFWATWCNSCRKEIPDLKVFTDKYRDKIQVVAIPSGESREIIKNHIQEYDINFLMILDGTRKIWNQYLVRGTPSHFLIGEDGKVASLRPGLAALRDLETMLTMLR